MVKPTLTFKGISPLLFCSSTSAPLARNKLKYRILKNSETSMTRPLLAHLSWLIRFELEILCSSSKQIFRDILEKFSYFIMKMYVECTHYNHIDPHPGNYHEYTQHTIVLQKIKTTSLNYSQLPPDLVL